MMSNKIWVTKDGERIKIKDMTDLHLSNTIKMLERKAVGKCHKYPKYSTREIAQILCPLYEDLRHEFDRRFDDLDSSKVKLPKLTKKKIPPSVKLVVSAPLYDYVPEYVYDEEKPKKKLKFGKSDRSIDLPEKKTKSDKPSNFGKIGRSLDL